MIVMLRQTGLGGKKSEGIGELDTAHLVTLLNKDRALLTPGDSQKMSSHFRNKVKRAREEAHIQGISVNYADLIRSVLDYRNWYEFRLFYQRGEDGKRSSPTGRSTNLAEGKRRWPCMYPSSLPSLPSIKKAGHSAADPGPGRGIRRRGRPEYQRHVRADGSPGF